ncbi:hypothetical protein Ddye_002075 [Dipteronia dyeriana]|uniref:Uncharacterized protein n=1 Tax=Dipteronia dyeriana TaxID=168575 RepID=A0AAD9XQC4_9ROSI|nr:hypothetical protein Ddye_002075 [Dipteronia dyeriana]
MDDDMATDQQFSGPVQQSRDVFVLGTPFDTGAGPSQQKPEWVKYKLNSMKGYIDISFVDLRKEMKDEFSGLDSRIEALELSFDGIRGTNVPADMPFTPIIDPHYSHPDTGFTTMDHGIGSRQHDGVDPGGYDIDILPSDGDD